MRHKPHPYELPCMCRTPVILRGTSPAYLLYSFQRTAFRQVLALTSSPFRFQNPQSLTCSFPKSKVLPNNPLRNLRSSKYLSHSSNQPTNFISVNFGPDPTIPLRSKRLSAISCTKRISSGHDLVLLRTTGQNEGGSMDRVRRQPSHKLHRAVFSASFWHLPR